MKVGLFIGNNIIEDVNRKPTMIQFDLTPLSGGDDAELKFAISHTFDIILQDLYKQYSEEELLEAHLYMAFFK
jgi:hypothetical protein